MRHVTLVVLLLACVTPVRAGTQEEKPDPSARYQRMVDAVTRYRQDWQKKQRARMTEWEQGGRKGPVPALRMVPPVGGWIDRFREAAGDYQGTEGCVPFHVWVAVNGLGHDRDDDVRASVELLMLHHARSGHLAPLAKALPRLRRVLGRPAVAAHLDALVEENRHPEVRASALFARSEDVARRVPVGSGDWEVVKSELLRAKRLTKDAGLLRRIDSIITGKERLALGATSPDIEGEDIDGVPFKLSDYKGKVIVLDFWGDW